MATEYGISQRIGFSGREGHALLSLLRCIVFSAALLCAMPSYAQNWSRVGDTLNNAPTMLFYDSIADRLLAAGSFSKVGTKWITGVASWNGSAWDSLGHGIDFYDTIGNNTAGNVHAFVYFNGALYCGGTFQKAGNVFSNGLARWNGSAWDSVPGGDIPAFRVVHDMEVYNGELYICGSFDSVGAMPAAGIAKWDGATWSTVGGNYPFLAQGGIVGRMEFYHGNLYVSGNFADASGNECRIAKWDGSAWEFMSSAVQGSLCSIWDLEVYDDELYAAGLFYAAAGSVANGIIKWNDTTWTDVGGSIDITTNPYPTICDMEVHDGKLYCGGNFNHIGGIPAEHLASWDGTNWCGYQTTFDNKIGKLAFFGDTLYISGGFQVINGNSYPWVAKWIGGSFVDTCGNTTGIAEPEPANSLTVYPNPSDNVTYFQFSGSSTMRQIIVTDQLGREIWRQETSEQLVAFPAHEFPAGVYFYRAGESDNLSFAGKFIIQH